MLTAAVGLVAMPSCDNGSDGDADADVSSCPDGTCSPDEDAESCPEDCSRCRDGLCTGDENAETCPEDCPTRCGDGACTDDEDACSCEDDCAPVCDDGCCTHDETALSCYPDCGSCGDSTCTAVEETALSCPEDCPARCGDGAVTHDEECDDGNVLTGDGCDFDCRYSCHGPEDCSDENDCTTDVCVEVEHGWACDHEPVSEGASCNDGTWCNGDDTCNDAGECAHHAGDPCTEVCTVCHEGEDRCEVIEPGEVIDGEEVRVELEGSLEKGPFVIGSSLAVSVLDSELDPTGDVYHTETINDRGEFELGFTTSFPVALEGNGYFYNELTGALSASTLTLRALYGPTASGAQPANLNVVTHLTTHRIRALVASGWPFGAAVVRAERELIPALNITAPLFVPDAAGTEMSLLGGDTDANAYLLALGSVLLQVAENRRGSVEANLQEVLNTYALDLADGTLSPAAVEEVGEALWYLDTAEIEWRLGERLGAIGATAEVPHLDRILDQDRDGYANTDDCDALDPAMHPGAVERCNNLDDDCDGVIPEDADGDGFHDARCGGDDCDDGDPAVHPGVIDVCGDGVDSDCNGSDAISCFVTIPAGTFNMGSPAGEVGRDADEPQHEVRLTHDFEILNTEVTQAQYTARGVSNPSHYSLCGGSCPVEMVSWNNTAEYCNELSELAGLATCYVWSSWLFELSDTYSSPYDCPGYRLPTEAEWEYAARAGTTTSTYNGDLDVSALHCDHSEVLDPIAWWGGNSSDTTHAVGTRRPNAWGLYDMLGNVGEWCHDWYHDYDDFHPPLPHVTDPWGRPELGVDVRVVRGGALRGCDPATRAADRGSNFPYDSDSGPGLGFRPVRSIEP